MTRRPSTTTTHDLTYKKTLCTSNDLEEIANKADPIAWVDVEYNHEVPACTPNLREDQMYIPYTKELKEMF
jgi:hypothetical protein